jgi:hypothetical protein
MQTGQSDNIGYKTQIEYMQTETWTWVFTMYSIFRENRIGNPDWAIRRQRWRTTLDTIHRTKTCKHKREYGHYTMNPLYSWSACHQMANREFRFNIGLLVYNTKGMTDHDGLPCHLHIKNVHCRVGDRVCRWQALKNTAICFHTQLSLLIQWHSKVFSKIDASFHSIYIYAVYCSSLPGKLYS